MSELRPPIRIVIADDHPLVRDGLRKLLEGQSEFRVIGEAADGIEALERAKALEPDVLLLDLAMPRMNGLEVLSALAGSTTGGRTVLLTAAIEGEETVRALRLGARAVVLKESATEQLYLCIRAVMRGEFWIDRQHVGDLLQAVRQLELTASLQPPPAATLTARERQDIAAAVEGASHREIGKHAKGREGDGTDC